MIRLFSSPVSIRHKVAACIAAVLVLLPLLGLSTAQAQDGTPNEVVIFVLDLSGSMNEPFDANQTKLDVAKAAFVEAFADVSPDARVGLRTYGDQLPATNPEDREASCTTDTRLVSPIAALQRERLIGEVQSFTALGDTPMGLALQAASTDIPPGATGTIVLFSDGRDECFDADLDGDPARGPSFGQDPCETAKAITAGDSAVDRVVTVGFRADAAAETELRCIADSTGGSYTSIESPEDARDALPQLLVKLSAPREAQRLIGREIEGTPTTEDAPSIVRLDEVSADRVLYTDEIDMNTQLVYAFDGYGPGGGTVTATVFGLPAEPDLTFDLAVWVPELDRTFFAGEQADTNAGLPARQTASIRCTGCQVTGGPHDVFWILSLTSTDPDAAGTYEIEMLIEGPAFGGVTTSCAAPQECFYPSAIAEGTNRLAEINEQLGGRVDDLASEALIAERDQLREETLAAQGTFDAAEARSTELEERIATAPPKSNSFKVPALMILAGILLALAPLNKLRRAPRDDDEDDEETDDDPEPIAVHTPNAAEPERSGPSLDVGPAPAVSPNRKGGGNSWDAELEAAKEALAGQRPERPRSPAEAASAAASSASQAAGVVEPESGRFTAEQHAAAKAAAEQIASQKSSDTAKADTGDVADAALPGPPAMPAKPLSSPIPQITPTSDVPAVSSTEPAVIGDQATEQLAAQQAAAEKTARETAAHEAAEQAAAEQAAREAAEVVAAQQAAELAEHEAREAAEQAAAEQAAAEQAAAEQAAREAAEKAAAEQAAREAAEKAAAEQAAREAAEKAAAEQAAREAAEKAAAEQAAREAAEKAAAEQAAREAAEKAAAEQAAREAAEKAAAEQAAREAAEKAAAEQAAREAAEKAAAEQAAREAAEKAAAEQAAREAAEKAAAEQAAREAAEKAAAEAAERLAAEKAAAERAAAERAAAEAAAAQAAEQAAADRAAAEKASAERAAAEAAAAQAAEQAAADRAAAEKASAERAAAEAAAAQAAVERAEAEKAAAQAAAALAAEQAAAQAAAEAAASAATATPTTTDDSPMTDEERRQQARQRMLAKQNIVASSSSDSSSGSPAASKATTGSAGAISGAPKPGAAPAPAAPARQEPTDPGWYPDPAIVGQYRWWDGKNWTGHTSKPSEQGTES